MTREEILTDVQTICRCEVDDTVICRLLDRLEEALPNSVISDIIFHDFRDLTPEQVVEEAMRREAYAAAYPYDEARHPCKAMSRTKMLNMVRAICFGIPRNDVITPLLDELYKALPHGSFSDLIYHNWPELTPEEVVDEAIRREIKYLGSRS